MRWLHGFYSGSTACKAFPSDRLPGSELCFPRGPRLSPANPPRPSPTCRFVVITWQGAGSAGPGRRWKRQKLWRTEQSWLDGDKTCPQICLGRGGAAWNDASQRPESGKALPRFHSTRPARKPQVLSTRGTPNMGSSGRRWVLQLLPPLLGRLLLCYSLFFSGLAQECPAPCRCLGERLDCSRLRLREVPALLPSRMVQL